MKDSSTNHELLNKLNNKFSWIDTHNKIVHYLLTTEHDQKSLIDLLKSVGITPFNDRDINGNTFELDEIDPFTFFFYIYKYGSVRRLKNLQEISKKLGIEIPTDDYGLPFANPQKVWFFPYKNSRNNNEVARLWAFFKNAVNDTISNESFADILNIKNVGRSKITEALFYINPDKYLPINSPVKEYLKNIYNIKAEFNTYNDYLQLLKKIKAKENIPFYELSYKAWQWNNEKKQINYWIFQGNPKFFDYKTALEENFVKDWTVTAHKNKIKTGDKVILWITGENAGCYALAEVTNEPKAKTNSEDDHLWKIENNNELKVGIKITHNLVNNPITKSEIEDNEYLSNLKVGNQGTNFIASEEEYNIMLELASNRNTQGTKMNYPLNTIFYGPPGTGKTYNTILRAAEIIENRKILDYEDAKDVFNKNLGDQIEFITFHQNYSYEDFIQGLRPDTDNDLSLTFDRKDGIFKLISDRALENLKLSEKAPDEVSKEFMFDTGLGKFIDEIQENEETYKINDTAYIFEIEADAFRYTGEKWSKHSNGLRMKFSDLKEFYLNDIQNRKEIKKLNTVSGLAKQHATYYFLVYKKILKLIPEKIDIQNHVEKKDYVIIIDEINRANISRVFGELITLIEPDKRSHGAVPLKSKLPSGEEFTVPSNLYIIGTMNTADKSIALLDIALRRRFEFEAMYPRYTIEGQEIYDIDVLKKINKKIVELKGYDFQIGHAYFMEENSDLEDRMNKKVIPLLLEYFMNDEKEVKSILKNAGLEIEENSWPLRINAKQN